MFGGTNEFLPLFGKDGGRTTNGRKREGRRRREVKGGIVAGAAAKGGEGWRGKRGRCSHTKKLKGNPTAIGSVLRNASSFVSVRVSRANIHVHTHIYIHKYTCISHNTRYFNSRKAKGES